MISAHVIDDSKNEFGNRITTMIVTFPRIILAEFNTHRMFSRNTASSRAIPFEKMVKSIEENPFIPIAWQKDHKGMQGMEYFTKEEVEELGLIADWLADKDEAVAKAKRRSSKGVTKQICNRDLEEYMWTTVIVTATEWENFFALRCPSYRPVANTIETFRSKKDAIKRFGVLEHLQQYQWFQVNLGQAEIHMMALAEAMWDAYNESTPKELKAGEWHIPFGDKISLDSESWKEVFKFPLQESITNELKIKIATARCARVSYTVVGEEGKPDNYENDIKLHDRLAASGHMSPFEHCAKAMDIIPKDKDINSLGWSGNFRGFIQYRKLIPNENIV